MKIINRTLAIVFSLIGVVSLVAGLFGAWHQFVLAGICALMATVLWMADDSDNNEIRGM